MTTAEHPPVFCTVEFVQGSRLYKEQSFVPGLPVVQNGPPGTSSRSSMAVVCRFRPIRSFWLRTEAALPA